MFDETFDRDPLRLVIGTGQVIPGFEEAVVGMKPGDSKSTELPPEMSFGTYQDDMVAVVPKKRFAEWKTEPEVGEQVPIPRPDGPAIEVTVTEITESTVTVDANHPLAGENLSFDIELIDSIHGPN